MRHHSSSSVTSKYTKFQERDKKLNDVYFETKTLVHAALCGERG